MLILVGDSLSKEKKQHMITFDIHIFKVKKKQAQLQTLFTFAFPIYEDNSDTE